jgi:hypothetical protein
MVTPGAGQPMSQIPNYMTQSIVMVVASCLCCLLSLPFSIIALVNANQVNSKISMNDMGGAMSASKNAKLFNWIALGMVIGGALLGIVWFILVMIGAASNIFNR